MATLKFPPLRFLRPIAALLFSASLALAAEAPPDPAFSRKLQTSLQKNLSDAEADALLIETEQRLLKSPKNQGYLEAVGLLHLQLKRWENA
jgi:hypothetical protein